MNKLLKDLPRRLRLEKSKRCAIFAIAVAVALCACKEVSAQEALSGAQIQSALSDKSVVLSCIDGTKGAGRYTMGRNFGSIKGTYRRPGAEPVADVGQVRAEGNRLCLRFKLLNAGEENCFNVVQPGPGRFQFSVGFVRACDVVVQ